jgi:stage IV sporulation protein B
MENDPDRDQLRTRRIRAAALAALSVGVVGTSPIKALAAIPPMLTVPVGQSVALPWSQALPLTLAAGPGLHSRVAGTQAAFRASRPGLSSVALRLFGWLPVGRVPVRAVVAPEVVPGGQSIGVAVRLQGVVVTGYHFLSGPRGVIDPARSAGIAPGDRLISADGRTLTSASQLVRLTEQAGLHDTPLRLQDDSLHGVSTRWVWPAFNTISHQFQLGIYVKTRATGVGTLTFWKPGSLGYAALGHSITDGLSARPAPVKSGSLTAASIVGIVPGAPNHPGEKIGVMGGTELIGGSVSHNGVFGLAGKLERAPELGPRRPVPVAMEDQVHAGPARIETVVDGNRPQSFGIRILATYPQLGPAPKGILFQVTDPRLLEKTGGIVQGMSGSPILQDGRLVGAVTHVFIDRPDIGYGCYAEWMLRDVR